VVTSLSGSDEGNEKKKSKPCPYGMKCYRKNVQHFKELSHPKEHPLAVLI